MNEFEGADWRLICDLQKTCKNLYDPKDSMKNNFEITTIINADWTLLKLKFPTVPLSTTDEIFNEYENWMLGIKHQGLYEFENLLKETLCAK